LWHATGVINHSRISKRALCLSQEPHNMIQYPEIW
jgi:hypothetical protein